MARPTHIIQGLLPGQNWQESFRRLFEQYCDRLYGFFQRRGLAPEDCRDLTQEVFFSVYKGLKDFRPNGPFENWVYTIARNVYLREIERRTAARRSARHVPLDETDDSLETARRAAPAMDSAANALDVLLEKERRARLRQALQELPPQMRRCVQLRVMSGLSNREIAAMMGLTVNTVKTHMRQARNALRKRLGP